MTNKDGKQFRKIREFEWYEVETKVREIMSDLLQPFNKKQTEDTIKINEMKRTQTTILKKLEDHDFLLEREEAQKPTYIQLQDEKIANIAQQTIQTQIQTQAAIKRMETIIAVYQQKITQLNQLEARLDRQVAERLSEFCSFKEGIEREVQLMTRRQDQQIEEVNQFKNMTKGSVSKMESRMISFDNRLKQLEDDHRHRTSDIKKLQEDMVTSSEKMAKVTNKVINLSARVEDREKDTKLSEKFLSKVKEIESEMSFITNFLESYQPLYVQMMISNALDSCMEGRPRRKLCIYQEKTYAQLHQHILNNDKLTLNDLMATYSNQIRRIINRNKKYVIHLSVAETVKHGGNIYQFHIDDLANIDEDEKDKKNSPAPFDAVAVAKVVEEKMATFGQQIKSVVAEQLAPTKAWISELQDQALLRSMEYDKKHEENKGKLGELATRAELQEKHTQRELSKLNSDLQRTQTVVNNFRDYIKDILNFGSVINHIVIQDEIDRQGTALYAIRGNKQEPSPAGQPTYQLDPNCANCETKTTNLISQAFKMACLTYNPSLIKIDQQVFSREEILEISTNILEKLKKKLWTNDINKLPEEAQAKGSADKAGKRRANSTIKDSPARQTVRQRQFQTLLPTLGNSSRRESQRKNHLSVFY